MRAATIAILTGLALTSAGTRAADPPKGWEFVGRTEAAASADVRPRVAGELTRLAVREGDAVRKGDLLAELDPRPYQLDVDAATGRVKAAEARLQAAKLKTANARRLAQERVVGQDEVNLGAAAEAEAEAGLAVARAEADRAKLNLAFTRLSAPFDGRVARVRAAVGELVTDRSPVLTVAATDRLHVTFDVPEGVALRLRRDGLADPGELAVAVGFAQDDGHPHAAKLDLVGTDIDPKTGAARFRAVLPNPKGLLVPGASARVRLVPTKAAPAGPPAGPPPPKAKGDVPARVTALRAEQIAALKELLELTVAGFQSGRVSYDAVLDARGQLLAAEVEAAETDAARVALYEAAAGSLRAYEEVAKAQMDAGRGRPTALLAIKARRLDVEIRLEQARGRAAR